VTRLGSRSPRRRSWVGGVYHTALTLLALVATAEAHKPSDTVLDLHGGGRVIVGTWEIALADLDHAVDLDADGSGIVTGAELAARRADIASYALAHLHLDAGGACAIGSPAMGASERAGTGYAVLALEARCPGGRALALRYDLFFDFDAQHRGLLRWSGPTGRARVLLSSAARTAQVPLARRLGLLAEMRAGRPAAVIPAAALLLALLLLARRTLLSRR